MPCLLSCPTFLLCLLHIFLSLVNLTVLQQWHFPQKHCLPNEAPSLQRLIHDLSPSRPRFYAASLSRLPLSCCVSCTFFSLWFTLQYCDNGISLQKHCLPNEAPSLQCLIMTCLLPAAFSCRVLYIIPSLVYLTILQQWHFPPNILLHLLQLPFYLCLTPDLSLPPATSLSCIVSF
jgi:hypothetical protein